MTTNKNPLADLNAQLNMIAANFATDTVKVQPVYLTMAELFLTGDNANDVREVLNKFIDAAETLKRELPGRAIKVGKCNGYRIWNTRDDAGCTNGKKATIRIELTEDERNGRMAGCANWLN